ncbi:MAG: carbohydrate ABC transporter permease [Spirochaetaceae bacterium]|nr:carbohydrate ABC transporter permease [Spirochaetaceae bacterium]
MPAFSIVNSILLLLVVFVTVYPLVYMISVSLSSSLHVMRGQVTWFPRGLTLGMYKLVLTDPRIPRAYLNTITYVVLGTAISLAITSMAAYALSKRHLPFNKGFTMLIVFTMFFNGGMIPTFLVVRSLGIMDSIWAMVLPQAVSAWLLWVMRTYVSGLPEEMEDAARIDGLRDFGIFVYIVLPLSRAALAAIGLFYAVALWNNFLLPLLYLRESDLFPLQVILRNLVIMESFEMAVTATVGVEGMVIIDSLKYAAITVCTLPIIMVYPLLQKHFTKGVMIGAVKG